MTPYIGLWELVKPKEVKGKPMIIIGSSETVEPLKGVEDLKVMRVTSKDFVATRYIYKCSKCGLIIDLPAEPKTLYRKCPKCKSSKMTAKAIDKYDITNVQVYTSTGEGAVV